jgi:hypothetical protein
MIKDNMYFDVFIGCVIAIITFALFTGCDYDDPDFDDYCVAGHMKCENNYAYMCDSDNYWVLNQNCTAINETCYYNMPSMQSGFTGLASCEK